ncbi:unnamed protein product [Orchesella dallaii]|uniref:Uncharacterized protein n=1 Tax=Orchesella dallaii TaxID=48710 RepID=A0ABP1PX43_9HEXA
MDDNWANLSLNTKKLAEVLHNVTGGDKRKLLSKAVNKDDGIWGKVAAQPFPLKPPDKKDRHLLNMIWNEKRKTLSCSLMHSAKSPHELENLTRLGTQTFRDVFAKNMN